MHGWHGLQPFTPYHVVQGHEFSAVVEAVADLMFPKSWIG
jgi:hypothetical protein